MTLGRTEPHDTIRQPRDASRGRVTRSSAASTPPRVEWAMMGAKEVNVGSHTLVQEPENAVDGLREDGRSRFVGEVTEATRDE